MSHAAKLRPSIPLPNDLPPLHRFHPYCARFPSEIVEAVLERYTSPGDSVFDPFCGSGTTLGACLAHQRRGVDTDIDVLAGMLWAMKCVPHVPERCAAWRARFAAELAALATIARAAHHSQQPHYE